MKIDTLGMMVWQAPPLLLPPVAEVVRFTNRCPLVPVELFVTLTTTLCWPFVAKRVEAVVPVPAATLSNDHEYEFVQPEGPLIENEIVSPVLQGRELFVVQPLLALYVV